MKLQHDKERLTNKLLKWYDEHARILPWRQDASPYRVWVSEIMLQQTRVEAVKPYFERFMEALPTMVDLANAEDDELAKLWEGLGYYHRVRNMKKCAIYCVEHYCGNLPSAYEELLKLPGIGSYTAGAVASIAFGQPVPAIDGNVLRVFSRVLISEDDILKESTKKKFQTIVKHYIPKERCGAFNQALMEIGATVCVPNAAPRCNICPIHLDCKGYQNGDAQRLPIKTTKKQRKIENRTIVVLVCGKQVQLIQRKDTGLLSGLYEFINSEGHMKKTELIDVVTEQGYKIKQVLGLHPAKHIFSHIEWHMKGYLVEVESITSGMWCNKQELDEQYAIPTAFRVYRDALFTWWEVNKI